LPMLRPLLLLLLLLPCTAAGDGESAAGLPSSWTRDSLFMAGATISVEQREKKKKKKKNAACM